MGSLVQKHERRKEGGCPRIGANDRESNRADRIGDLDRNPRNGEDFPADDADQRGSNHAPRVDISDYQRNPRRIGSGFLTAYRAKRHQTTHEKHENGLAHEVFSATSGSLSGYSCAFVSIRGFQVCRTVRLTVLRRRRDGRAKNFPRFSAGKW